MVEAEPAAVPAPAARPRWRRPVAALGALLVLGAAGWGINGWRVWEGGVTTDDAFIEARVAPVSAKVRGTVIAVLVRDNEEVREGAVLVRLDPRDAEVQLAQARAAVAVARGRLAAAESGVPMTDEATRSQVARAEAAVQAARVGIEVAQRALDERIGHLRARRAAVEAAAAEVEARQAAWEQAARDRARVVQLAERQLVAQQEVDRAEAAFTTARAALEAARRRLDVAAGEVAQAEAEVASRAAALAQARHRFAEAEAELAAARSRRGEVAVRRADVAAAEAQLAEALADLREAELGLEYTTIRAPISGRVTKKTVEVGQVVQPGQPLLALVNLDEVWVVANYKETQLTHVRPGQPATVLVDTYPGLRLRARVESIQGGTGARFSLLPPENASGNFVKVVQRIPVKLVLEPGQEGRRLLVPGMSVVPTIHVR